MDDKTLNPWEVVERRQVLDASPWLRVYEEHVRLPNGLEIPDFLRVESSNYVKVFAVTPGQQVVLIQHYKHGPQKVSFELPAGGIESNETDPLEAAKRELLEETGMIAEAWEYLGKCYIDGNRGLSWMYGYLATGVTQLKQPTPEPSELQVIHLYPLDKIREFWQNGQIEHVGSIAVIGWALAKLP